MVQKVAEEVLGVFEAEKGLYFVDDTDRKILFKVLALRNGGFLCTCPEYEKNKSDANYQCVHIAAVISANHYGVVTNQSHVNGHQKPKINEEFIKEIDGKSFVLYSGILDLATQCGLQKLECEILQFPNTENSNTCICKAMATFENGKMFVDIGDANMTNCNPKVAKHLIRMASTRAKARVLRDATAIGITCLEELGGDLNDVVGEERTNAQTNKQRQQRTSPPQKAVVERPQSAQSPATVSPPTQNTVPESRQPKAASSAEKPNTAQTQPVIPQTAPSVTVVPAMSEAQKRAVLNLGRRRNIPEEQIEDMAKEQFGISFTELSVKDASIFIRHLQQQAA